MARTATFRQLIRYLQAARRVNLAAQGELPPIGRTEAQRLKLPPRSRRRFLKLAALATRSALATSTLPHWEAAWSKASPRIAIVGGGIAG